MLKWQLAFIFCIYINLTFFSACARAQTFDARVQIFPAYIIASEADYINSTTCGKELQNFREAVDQRILWSLKVLDSSGVIKPGFLYGNNYWLGSRSQCLDTMNTNPLLISQREILNNMLFRDPRKEFPPFQVNYFVAHFRHNSTLQYHVNAYDEFMITLGLCLPASCSVNELSFILEKIFHNRDSLINDLYSADFQLIQIKDLKGDNKWQFNGASGFIWYVPRNVKVAVTSICLGLSFLMIIIGTMYDIFVHQKNIKKNEEHTIDDSMASNEIKIKANLFSHQESKIGKVLTCFSAYTNTKEIFNMKLDTGAISVFHGIKFLIICLTIIAHIIYYTFDSLDNKVWLQRLTEKYFPYVIHIISMGVDIFFFLSGYLQIYWYSRDKTNVKLNNSIDYKEKLIEFFNHIMNRFIRLTPAYMTVLVILQLSSAWFDKTSQFYMYERSHETCSKYWWRNLLYINNLFGLQEMCMSWSWYLANDMQFYAITSILLILSTTHFGVAVKILSALLVGSVILSGYISYTYEYIPTNDEFNRLLDVLYIVPWIRIHSYIIGIIFGYIVTQLNINLIFKNKIIIWCCCLSGVWNIAILFAFYMQYFSVLTTAIYVALHRIFWVINIAWILTVFGLYGSNKYGGNKYGGNKYGGNKYGGVVNQLLSFKGWIPLSRLSYCAYLLNPLIIRSIHLYSETPMHFEPLSFILLIPGYIIIIYSCSYILSLMVEVPCISLTRLFIQNPNRTHRKLL